MDDALRRSAAHVFVESLDAPTLSDEDEHHLRRVLRLRPGEAVSASDGAGRWRPCRVADGGLIPDGDVVDTAAASPPITVGFALAKGDRPEWIVQKLTEVGVDRILILRAARSIVRWDDAKAAQNLSRLAKVAREAAMQSRRTRLPELSGPVALDVLGADRSLACALAEPGGEPLTLASPCVLVGPEGGWTESERSLVARSVSLGPTILRVETAAIVAGARLVAIRESLPT
jgi:16S rRNA (uracil1498-N3)-methyltransferase